MSPDHLYFAYGSNLSVEQMRGRCPDSSPWRTAYLPAHRLAFGNVSAYRGGGVATILPDEGQNTQGLIYSLSDDDLAQLDRWEAYPQKYDRLRAQVFDAQGRSHAAWTYRLNDYYPNAPSTEYLGIIKSGYIAHGLGLDALMAALERLNEENNGQTGV
ncbi:MAG: gamma-glutamylcyclotransferase [SAR324 cluster bacterium]|nr:gamma-glutamylcyclotransferase [SAR324 cluster bacterium]